ncbi:ABC transporter permease [Thiocapsa marina]|uniref:ABC-2 type transporter n=1 Tax=Thiocapsa marina 5811 TaxID=768671 RepID=F9U6Z3_9GAMM|nr:ABC transporter permease [Thiocapsa marina]EGV20019.1 ABC-2 type transporter [Thiocapsa marina 5811]
MSAYLAQVWAARYFWMHLSLSDLRSRWRRSYFGVLWTIIQPLGLTLLLSLVLSRLFGADIVRFSVHILSGVVVWEFVGACCAGGSLSFVQADAYIKQFRQPLAIYSLRTVLTATLVLCTASLAMLGWTLVVLPQNFGWSWLAIATLYPAALLIGWPLATLLAYSGARFRDLPHAMGLVLQACWFVSPVYFEVRMFREGGLDFLVDYNPIYHLLQIVRAPLLDGLWPTATNYLFCFGTAALFGIFAIFVGRRVERSVIFYL